MPEYTKASGAFHTCILQSAMQQKSLGGPWAWPQLTKKLINRFPKSDQENWFLRRGCSYFCMQENSSLTSNNAWSPTPNISSSPPDFKKAALQVAVCWNLNHTILGMFPTSSFAVWQLLTVLGSLAFLRPGLMWMCSLTLILASLSFLSLVSSATGMIHSPVTEGEKK